MAGEVQTDEYRTDRPSQVLLLARQCGVTGRYGDVCVRFDPQSGQVKLCPFWYGLAVTAGRWHRGEARSVDEARAWLASEEYGDARTYIVRCLRKESAGLEPGAR